MALVNKQDPKKIFASQAPSQDVPAEFNNYERGWDESRKNNGKPTIKQFNKLQQLTDEKILWIHQNGSALTFDETMEYVEGAIVVKDGVLQQLKDGEWKSVIADGLSDTIQTFTTPDAGVDPVTGVADGAYFNVRSSSDDSYVDEYQNVGGSAVATGKRYLSALGVARQEKPASTVIDESGNTQQEINDAVEFTLDTVGDLRNYKARKNRQIVKVARHNENLTAESSSTWAWYKLSTDADDGFTVIQVTGVATGRWKICNKEKLNIFNFGVIDYQNIAAPSCNYYISNSNLTAYFAFCTANKLRAKVFGNILVEAGNYNLPEAGLIGDSKATTSLYCNTDQTGIFLTYGVLSDYNKAMGEPLQAITIRTIYGSRQQANLVKINTPSRGCVLRDVNMYTDGDCVNLDDAYYLNFDNCGLFGTWRANYANITLESDKFTGVGVRTSSKEINNILFHKCDFKDLKHFVVGQDDPFKGSNTILFSNTAFERCGDTALLIRGWNVTFLTCYFEWLDLHKNFKTGLTAENDVTILARTGSGVVQFLGQTIINLSNIRASDANVCVFNSILDMVSLSATYTTLPANFTGRMNHYKTYSSTPAIHWSGLTPVPQSGYVAPVRHIAQKDTNALRVSNRVEQSSHPYVSVEKMGTNYKSLVLESAVQFSSNNSKPLNGVDGLIADKPILVHVKGRQYRIGSATTRTEWIDIDGVFRIDKECPYYATKIALTVIMGGTANTVATDSFFNSLTGQAIADRIKMWRLTTARGTDYATNYAFAYQIGITGETTGNSSGHYIVNDLEIQVIQTVPTLLQAQYTGIYAQVPNFVSNPTQ